VITSQSQIVRRGWAAVLFGDDVVGFVRHEDILFVDAAVLATATSPPLDLGAHGSRNPLGAHATARK